MFPKAIQLLLFLCLGNTIHSHHTSQDVLSDPGPDSDSPGSLLPMCSSDFLFFHDFEPNAGPLDYRNGLLALEVISTV